jgi:hypothetical protein
MLALAALCRGGDYLHYIEVKEGALRLAALYGTVASDIVMICTGNAYDEGRSNQHSAAG